MKCLLDPITDCPIDNNENGDYCWACSPDGISERKLHDSRKINYYLNMAREVSKGSKCAHRHFGAIIVKDDEIIATGYNGTSRGSLNCGKDIQCIKDSLKDPNGLDGHGEGKSVYDNCPAIHAEMNACISAGRKKAKDSTMFVAEENGKSEIPCYLCRRFIIQAGIKDVYDGSPNNFRHYMVVPDFIAKENEWMRNKLKKEIK